jgi:hypothetical protein
MRNAVSGLGLAPDAAMVTFPIALFLPGSDIGPVEARRQEFYDGLTRWRSHLAVGGGGESPLVTVEAATFEDALVKVNHLMLANQWGVPGHSTTTTAPTSTETQLLRSMARSAT